MIKSLQKVLPLLVLLLLGFGSMYGQSPQYYNLNNSTGSNAIPLGGGGYATNKCQFLYGPGLFNSSGTTGTPAYNGMITTVYFRVNNYSSAVTYSDFTISLVQNVGTSTTFPSTTFGTLTPAFYQSSYSLPALGTNNWCAITLTTPFLYDPSLSLIFELKASTSVGGSSSSNGMLNSGTGSRLYGTYAATTGTISTATLVDFGFDLVPAGPCTAPPTAGTTTISKDTACMGTTVNLGLSGNSYGSGQTYQWEKATSPSGPWTNEGASLSFPSLMGVSPTSAGYNYYRCQVTCSTSTVASNIDSVFVPTPFAGGTYTINPSGSGPNNFTSFNAAVSAIGCGITGPVVFNVSPGTYNEQVVLPGTIGTTSTNTVTFNGNGATLKDSITAIGSNYATLRLDGADYITFKNLNIEAKGPTYGFAVHLSNNADWNTFDSCTMSANIAATATTTGAVVMSGSPISYSTSGANGSNNTFSNSTLSGGYFAYSSYGAAVTGNQNNDVINCQIKDFYVYGLYLIQNSGNLISQNTIERPNRTVLSSFYGVYGSTGCTDLTIERNRIGNQFGANPTYSGVSYNIYVISSSATVGTENKIFNNQISNFNGNSTAYGIYLPSATNVQVYNNTVSIDNAAATTGTIYGLYSTGTTNVDIKNNIFSITQGGTGTKYCLYFSGAGKTSNYNDLYMGSTGGTANHIGYYAANFTTLSAWQGANSNAWDQNSVSMDPMFAAPALGNHTPLNATFDNLGTPITAITTDINGVSRNATTPDIGAYEFSVSACSGPPTAGSTTINKDTTCLGATVNLGLVGNVFATGISYQWQSAASISGPWTPVGIAQTLPAYLGAAPANVGYNYYRCELVCGASTSYSVIDSVFVPTPFAGGTYTINPSGSGPNNFTSFNAAVNAMDCGIAGPVVFNVSPGTYNEQVTLPATIGATATNTVTFNGNGATLTDSIATTGANYATLRLDGADYITVKNLNIEARGMSYGFALHLSNGANWNTFDSCTMSANIAATSSLTGGVIMSGSPISATTAGANGSNNVFSNSTISGGYYATSIYGDAVAGNQNNDMINCIVKDFYFYGIYYTQNTGALISQNTVERPTRTTMSSFYGIYVSTGCTDMTIERNRVRNQFGSNPTYAGASYNIYVSSTSATVGTENRVYNNLVSNFNGNSTAAGIYLPSATNIQVYNNTVSIDNTAATAGTIYGLYSTGTTNVDVKNNILSITQGGTGTKYCIYFSTTTGKTSNYNNLYMGSTGGTLNYIGYAAANQTTFANWQAVNSNAYDQNGVSMDPMFLSPATGDHTPINAMMDNLGTPLAAVTNDINGAARNATTPDIGAYEFAVPPCVGTPSSAGTATASVDSTCIGGPVKLTLTGFPIASGIGIQWEESYGANIWNPIIGATTATYTTALISSVSYRAAVSCNFGTAVYSNVVNVSQQAMVACYCSPFTGQTLHTNSANYITNVSIAGTSLNNPTSAVGPGGYTRNYPITATTSDTLTQMVNYTLTTALSSTSYDAIAWIDYDHNGTFDMGEDIAITGGVGTINIPITSYTGYTGMRIRASSNTTTYTSIDACLNAATGYETEDYVIYIAPNIPCSGTPSTAGTASVNNDTLCVMGDVKLSLVNYPVILGIGLNWQWSPAGANTFTDIPGATTDTFTVLGLNASMDFRARVTCTNPGGGTIYSNVNTVTVINPQLLSTIPGARCGTGEVALFAKAAPGQQVNWYAAPTGGAILSTGNVFITPSISTTTSYYAAASTGGGQPVTAPMPTYGSNYSGNVRGFWFTAPANFTITSLTSQATTLGNQSIAVVKFTGNVPPPSYSTVTNAFTTLYLTQNNPAVGPIAVNIPISAGEVIGIMAQTGGACSYGTPAGTYTSTIAGLPVTLTRMGMQYSLNTTAPMDLWQEVTGSVGTVAMTYVTGCEGTRTQVDATINPSGTGNLSTGGTVVGNLQANNTTVSYTTCNDTVAVINSGTTNMGATAAVVATPPTVQTFGGLPFVPRAYDIDPTTNGPATVTLYALQSEFTAYNSYVTSNSLSLPLLPTGPSDATGISHIVITQYHGDATAGTQGPFGLYSNANVELIPNSAITVTPVGTTYWKMTFPVSGFSGFFIHSGSSPLDIKLASIAAANYGNRNRVDWTSADESHTAYYEIERSADAKVFAAVGRQTAKGKAGNYSYWDEAPLNGINYYRLKIYNANGNYSYSDVVKAFVSSGNAIMVEAYPNPVTDVLQVKVSGAQGQDAHLLLTDIAGKVIRRIDMNSAATTLSMSGVANGIYLLKYVDNRHQQTIRITKQ